MKKISHIFIMWIIMGMIYLSIESIWKHGWTHLSMLIIGGFCGVIIGSINQIPKFYNMKILYQSLLGTIIVLFIEFFSGLFLNIWLNLNIWDYSDMPFNIMGQICPLYGFLWFLLMPFTIWLEDYIRYLFKWTDKYYTILSIYKELFSFK